MIRSILALSAVCSTGSLLGANTLLHCGRLIDGSSDKVRTEVTLVVSSNRITAIEPGYKSASVGDQVIDLKSRTVLPGLFDMHVHLQMRPAPFAFGDKAMLNPEDYAYRAAAHAKATLLAGFTSVRDLGGEQVVGLKKAINEGILEGPRIIAAGRSIAITGGHADQSNGLNRELAGDPGPEKAVINGPDDARKAVRQRYKEGSDCIKVTATGGVLSLAKDGFRPQFTSEELVAVVQMAKDLGMPTAAHAHGAEGMKRAVLAGIGSIEHGTMMTEEVMGLMKERGTYYVPTLSAGKYTEEKAKVPGFYHPMVAMKALAISPLMTETFGKANRFGVKIAFGTDAGVFPHGDNAKEFQYLVEAGMAPLKAIQSATIEAAKLGEVDKDLGSIEPGKLADIIAVDANPLEDIKTLQQVRFVMKDGVIVKR